MIHTLVVVLCLLGGSIATPLPECPVWRIAESVNNPLTVNLEAKVDSSTDYQNDQTFEVKVISGDGDEFGHPGGAVVAWRPAFANTVYQSQISLKDVQTLGPTKVGWSVYSQPSDEDDNFDPNDLMFSCGFVLKTDSSCAVNPPKNPPVVQPTNRYLSFQTKEETNAAMTVGSCYQVAFDAVELQLQNLGDKKWQCYYRETGDPTLEWVFLGEYNKNKNAAAVAVEMSATSWACQTSPKPCTQKVMWSVPAVDCTNPTLSCPTGPVKVCLPGPPKLPATCFWISTTGDGTLDDSGLRAIVNHGSGTTLVGKDIVAKANTKYVLTFGLSSNAGNDNDVVEIRVQRIDATGTPFVAQINPRLTYVFYRYTFTNLLDCVPDISTPNVAKCFLTFQFTEPAAYKLDDFGFCEVTTEEAVPSPLPSPSPDIPEDGDADIGSKARKQRSK